jgi:hypothetical protein
MRYFRLFFNPGKGYEGAMWVIYWARLQIRGAAWISQDSPGVGSIPQASPPGVFWDKMAASIPKKLSFSDRSHCLYRVLTLRENPKNAAAPPYSLTTARHAFSILFAGGERSRQMKWPSRIDAFKAGISFVPWVDKGKEAERDFRTFASSLKLSWQRMETLRSTQNGSLAIIELIEKATQKKAPYVSAWFEVAHNTVLLANMVATGGPDQLIEGATIGYRHFLETADLSIEERDHAVDRLHGLGPDSDYREEKLLKLIEQLRELARKQDMTQAPGKEGLSDGIKAAIIAGLFGVVAALIGILPQLLPQLLKPNALSKVLFPKTVATHPVAPTPAPSPPAQTPPFSARPISAQISYLKNLSFLITAQPAGPYGTISSLSKRVSDSDGTGIECDLDNSPDPVNCFQWISITTKDRNSRLGFQYMVSGFNLEKEAVWVEDGNKTPTASHVTQIVIRLKPPLSDVFDLKYRTWTSQFKTGLKEDSGWVEAGQPSGPTDSIAIKWISRIKIRITVRQ